MVDERRVARILVVEDNDALRRGICMALGEHWTVVDDESNGESAVARLRDRHRPPYQVVVTDLRLPGADGIAALPRGTEQTPTRAFSQHLQARLRVRGGFQPLTALLSWFRISLADW